MSKNQLSTCLRRDLGYDQYTPITEKEAYELAKTVVDLFEEYRIYYDVHRTEDEKKKPQISFEKTDKGLCFRIGVARQNIKTATIEPKEGGFPDGRSILCWD